MLCGWHDHLCLSRIWRIFHICLEQITSEDQVHQWNGSRVKVSILRHSPHRDGHDIITTIYRNFCPWEWKRGTFRSLVQQAYIICSSSHLLKEELKHLEDVFVMKNNFPIWVVKKILKEEKEKIDNRNNADKNKHTIQTDVKFESKDKSHLLLLLYQGEKMLPLNKVVEKKFKKLFTQHS